jgi:hypothetical protein
MSQTLLEMARDPVLAQKAKGKGAMTERKPYDPAQGQNNEKISAVSNRSL